MNKVITLSAAILSALAAATAGAAPGADNGKHFGYGHGHGYHRPAYVAPPPVRHHYAPSRGHWHGGRWIAPVVVGGIVAAAVGSAYAYSAPTYTYAPPNYYAPAAVTYVAPARTGFDYADGNGDGYVTFDEASAYPHWQRNFGFMDRNRDGYLTRDEVAGWRYR